MICNTEPDIRQINRISGGFTPDIRRYFGYWKISRIYRISDIFRISGPSLVKWNYKKFLIPDTATKNRVDTTCVHKSLERLLCSFFYIFCARSYLCADSRRTLQVSWQPIVCWEGVWTIGASILQSYSCQTFWMLRICRRHDGPKDGSLILLTGYLSKH